VFEYIISANYHSAGIDNRKFNPVPVAVAVMTIAGNSAGWIHYGLKRPGHAVKKSTFSNIWSANNGQNISHAYSFALLSLDRMFMSFRHLLPEVCGEQTEIVIFCKGNLFAVFFL
jgi:hypothetical protein